MQEIKLFNTEEFKIEKVGKGNNQKVILKGNAMPLNETSRNGVFYRPESVKKNYKSLEGVPFLFAHQQNEVRHVLGKVEKVNLTNSHVTYEADIDSEEKEFIRKSEKGYIKHVSVGCLIDPSSVEFDEEKQIAKVDVIEFCELSSAPVPGFKNTDAQLGKQNLVLLAESLGKEDIIKKLKETQDEEQPEQLKEEQEETPEDKEDKEDKEVEEVEETKETEEAEGEEPEKTTEEQVSELNSKLNEMEGKISEVVNQMAVLESKVDTLLDEAEDEDDKDEDDKDKDDTDEKKDKDEEDDEDDEDETEKKENKDDEDKELEPVEEEFKSKEEPIQEIKQKEKTLKIDKKSTEINLENQIKQNRRY
jgi:hypothetical protein